MHLVHPTLAWAFLLVLVPVLIHLINLMRHRRIKWAAMEFLLESYRRHSNWIRFRQLVLLLLRMAAFALAVGMLAQLITPDQWSRLFGGKVTHHYVLLDDSYSMSDRGGVTRAYDRAWRVVRRIGLLAAVQDGRQLFTLITFSQAAAGLRQSVEIQDTSASSAAHRSAPDGTVLTPLTALHTEISLEENFDTWLEEVRPQLAVSQRNTGPGPALTVLMDLMEETTDDNRVLYVISDFRNTQWNHPEELVDALDVLSKSGAELCFVHCVQKGRPNLGIADIVVSEGTIAAGIPITVDVHVTNHGDSEVTNIPLRVQSKYFDRDEEQAFDPSKLAAKIDVLAVEPLERIGPRESAVQRVQVFFPQPGQHVIEATLPDDAVEVDNHRFAVIDVPEGVPVLLIDGSPRRQAGSFVTAVYQPSSRARTGIHPEINDMAFLRDTTPEELRKFHTVYLLDVPRLDPSAVRTLEQYVSAGGGLCIFMGPEMQLKFYNEFYADGAGLFPLPLDRKDLLPPAMDQQAPDFVVDNHSVFRIFLGRANPFLSGVSVEQYVRAVEGWRPGPQSMVRVLARLRNGQPLCVERRFGDGRVVAMLTTVTPEWNNWARDPSFVVMLLDLQSYLVATRRPRPPRLVGAPIEIQLDATRYRSDLSFVVPDQTTDTRRTIDKQAFHDPENSDVLRAILGHGELTGAIDRSSNISGIYETWAVTREGQVDVTRYALNIDPHEGDLHLVSPAALADKVGTVKIQIRDWEEFEVDTAEQAGFNWSSLLLGGLVLLLIGEQAMAHATSYHVERDGARRSASSW